MGRMNLLKANWYGKVGQTVGAKWKNRSTIRTFTPPSNPDTPAQQNIRAGFKGLSQFLSMFSPMLKSLSALNTKGMSVRNALIKLNKEQVIDGQTTPKTLQISRGGLPGPSNIVVAAPAGLRDITFTWTPAVGATISEKAKVVAVAVSEANNFVLVGSALNSAGTLSLSGNIPPGATFDTYVYLLDYRGSAKVGSMSFWNSVTSPDA